VADPAHLKTKYKPRQRLLRAQPLTGRLCENFQKLAIRWVMRLFAPAKVETDTTSRFLATGRRPRRGRVEGNRTAGKRIARISLILVAHAGARFVVAQNPTIERSWPLKHTASGNVRQPKGECTVKCFLLATAVACLLTCQTANAKGCLKGAALGGVAGHMAHHTFLGIFGGCAGGLYAAAPDFWTAG
jgi:hypothetical protein